MTTPVSDAIIQKLQKLLNMARAGKGADAGTEAEAMVAMALAQKLMAKHNLSMAMVEASGETVTMAGSERLKEKMAGRAMYKWQQSLMGEVAKANYCRHFVGTQWYQTPITWSDIPKKGHKRGGSWRKRPYHVLVGREVNVTSSKHMFDYMCSAIERLVPIASNAQRLSRAAMSWKDGCSDRLQTRLLDRRIAIEREQREAAKAQATQANCGTALAIVTLSDFAETERNANYELMYGLEPGTLARRERDWEEGKEARAAEAARIQAEAQAALAAMTSKERARYERKISEERAKTHARWQRETQRERARRAKEAAKRDWVSYDAGSDAGADIGLDPQLSKGSSTDAPHLAG